MNWQQHRGYPPGFTFEYFPGYNETGIGKFGDGRHRPFQNDVIRILYMEQPKLFNQSGLSTWLFYKSPFKDDDIIYRDVSNYRGMLIAAMSHSGLTSCPVTTGI